MKSTFCVMENVNHQLIGDHVMMAHASPSINSVPLQKSVSNKELIIAAGMLLTFPVAKETVLILVIQLSIQVHIGLVVMNVLRTMFSVEIVQQDTEDVEFRITANVILIPILMSMPHFAMGSVFSNIITVKDVLHVMKDGMHVVTTVSQIATWHTTKIVMVNVKIPLCHVQQLF